jgi:hypothetical protein
VVAFQLRALGLLLSAGMTIHDDMHAIGIQVRKSAEHTIKLQDTILREMVQTDGAPRGSTRGLINPSRGLGPLILDFVHPVSTVGPLHRAALSAWTACSRMVDRALA